MKLQGTFVVRQIGSDIVAIPVGKTAASLNGMVLLNDVSRVIWSCLEQETDLQTMVNAVTDRFAVTRQQAEADILEFLEGLRQAQLLE